MLILSGFAIRASGALYIQQPGAMQMPNSADATPDFESIKTKLRTFANERDWDQFHSPKNLAMALVGEVGELVEHFQWLTQEQSYQLPKEKEDAVREELADVQIYLIMLAGKLDIDLLSAVVEKIRKNDEKYPRAKSHGTSRKYTDL